jgi:hypothetical protein
VTKSAKTRKTRRRAGKDATSTKTRTAPKRKATGGATRVTRPAAPIEQPSPEHQAAFLETVIASGEAAPLDEHGKLPAGATLEIVSDEAGNVKAVRRRYSMS